MRAGAPHGPRDRASIRRALAAGGVVWLLAAGGLALLSLSQGMGAAALPVDLAFGLVFGSIAAAGWLWLSVLLDVIAGEAPSRIRWTVALLLTALMAATPLLLAAAAMVAR